MVFKCQEDSFLIEYKSVVTSCEKAKWNETEGYNVILEDTILFPEGGGQLCDFGFIAGRPVKNVVRVGSQAVHFVETSEPFKIGEEVDEILDWERRYDNMQQHSGQHLVTAAFEQEFNLNTKAWWLGSETVYIELDAKNVTQDQLDVIEKKVNEMIAEGRPVTVKVYEQNDPNLTADVTRANRELPKDHVGPVRIINIEGFDSNMCCGTHVKNLSQLQCIKFLNVEKTKNKLLVHFLVGNRVINKVRNCYKREQELNGLLNGGPESHIELLKKLQINIKTSQRTLQKCLKEIAQYEALKFNQLNVMPKYYILHRTDCDGDFINTFLKSVTNTVNPVFFFVTVANDSQKGQMVLQGNPDDVTKLGPILCEILEGKGNGKNGKFQAKINNLKKLGECEKLIVEHFTD